MQKLYILGGLPGSGKSTTSKKLKEEEDCYVVSSDSLRLALNAGIYPRGNCYELLDDLIWELVEFSVVRLLEKNLSVGVVATNLNRAAKLRWVKLVRNFRPEIEIVLLWHTSNYDSFDRCEKERSLSKEEYYTIRQKLETLIELPSEEEGFKVEFI